MKICPKCNDIHIKSGIFCSRKCANSRIRSDETRNKIRNSLLNNSDLMVQYKNNFSNIIRTNGGRKKVIPRIITKCLYCGNDILHKINEPRKYHGACWHKCSGGLRENSTRKIRTIHNGFQMDSGAELKFAKLLDSHNIKWIKNSGIGFNYIDSNGKHRLYYPDFYLPDYDKWIETKGKYYIDELFYDKIKAYPEIEVIYDDNIKLPGCAHKLNITEETLFLE